MAVNWKHPEWMDRIGEWVTLRATARGSREVKDIGRELYLPMPSGFKAQGKVGETMYDAYLARAQYPEIMEPTLTGMVGLIHHQEPTIEMPTAMDFIREEATVDGQPLDVFHRRVTLGGRQPWPCGLRRQRG